MGARKLGLMAALLLVGGSMTGCVSSRARIDRTAETRKQEKKVYYRVVDSSRSKHKAIGRKAGDLFGRLICLGAGVSKAVR